MPSINSVHANLLKAVSLVGDLLEQIESTEPEFIEEESVQVKHLGLLKQMLFKLVASEKILLDIKSMKCNAGDVGAILDKVNELANQVLSLPTDYDELLEAEQE